MARVDIETSIVSHATAWPSRDVTVAGLQQQARDWWANERGVDYLLTLNCRHIANAHQLPRIYELLDCEGLGNLLICTPAEFLGDSDDDQQSDT